MSTKSLDARYVGRDEDAIPLEVAGARGSRVRGADGRSYVDFSMGWAVGNLGWAHPRVTARLRRFRGASYVNPRQLYAPWAELASRLIALAPAGLRRCFRVTGGTEAVEVALQVAYAATGRRRIVSLEGAYHGSSIAAHGIGSRDPQVLPIGLPGCAKLTPPLDARALHRLETLLAKKDVAAFVMEPVVCNLGATLVTEKAARALTSDSAYSTYGWHPLSVEAALATVGEFERHGDALLEQCERTSAYFATRLARMPFPRPPQLRIKGLAIGLEFAVHAHGKRLVESCRRAGLLINDDGEGRVTMFPALTIDRANARRGLDLLERCASRL